MSAPVTVTQADRLRALNTHLILNPHIPQRWRAQMLDGETDADRLVLAVARHRTAAALADADAAYAAYAARLRQRDTLLRLIAEASVLEI